MLLLNVFLLLYTDWFFDKQAEIVNIINKNNDKMMKVYYLNSNTKKYQQKEVINMVFFMVINMVFFKK